MGGKHDIVLPHYRCIFTMVINHASGKRGMILQVSGNQKDHGKNYHGGERNSLRSLISLVPKLKPQRVSRCRGNGFCDFVGALDVLMKLNIIIEDSNF
jgi:hypothetical protein